MTSAIQNNNVNTAESMQHATSMHVAQKSSWKGFQVQTLPKGAVNIADMAEEAALSIASKVGSKNVKKKQEEDNKLKKAGSGLLPGMSLYEAEIFTRALMQSGENDANKCLELVKKFFRDPTLQDAALRHAQSHLPESDPRHAELAKALEILQKESGAHIRAGYNIAPIEHKDLSPQEARDCYRFHILDYSSYERTFKNLMNEYSPENLPQTVDFLRKALGVDMQSLQPSCAPEQLHEVAEGLYVVQNLGTLYADAGKLCESTAKRFISTEPHPRELMLGILQNKDNSAISEPSLRHSMPFLVSKNPTRDAVFVRGVREIARNLPTKIYTSAEQRQKVLNMLQQNLDIAIEREEELEG